MFEMSLIVFPVRENSWNGVGADNIYGFGASVKA